MYASTVTFLPNTTGGTLRRKLRILRAEILYALALSNRAYYQGLNRF